METTTSSLLPSIVTPRLRLIALSRVQLQMLVEAPARLEAALGLKFAREVLTDRARRAIQIKVDKMAGAEKWRHAWLTYWLVVVSAENAGAGLAGFKGAPDAGGEVEIGYGIAPGFQNRGYSTEAARALTAWAFSEPACMAVTAKYTQRSNLASQKVLKNLGMWVYAEDAETQSWKVTRKAYRPPGAGEASAAAAGVAAHNRRAWDLEAQKGNPWTKPVSPEVIAAARRGEWEVLLTEMRPTPREWFPPLEGLEVLCLASGGGQQASILAAAGARVTLLDNSPAQLESDRMVAAREGLQITFELGDMRDLSMFPEGRFDLIFHPVSNIFVPDVRPVWREAHRVLKPGGVLLAGMSSPFNYLFDEQLAQTQGIYQVKHALPYSDLESVSQEERERWYGADAPLEFSHTLEEQIGGQIEAGFVITGFYESYRENDPISKYMPSYFATRAQRG